MRLPRRSSLLLGLVLVSLGVSLLTSVGFALAQDAAQEASPAEKKVLTIDDYGQWNRVRGAGLSPDGKWVTYEIAPNEGTATFYLESLTDDVKFEVRGGGSPTFSDDSKWVIYSAGSGERGGRGRGGDETPDTTLEDGQDTIQDTIQENAQRGGRGRGGAAAGPRRMVLMNLETKDKTDWANVANARFTDDNKYLTLKKPRAAEAQHAGTDLVLHKLDGTQTQNLGNVNEFAFNKGGKVLAYTVDAADGAGNGVYLLEMETGLIRPLDTSGQTYAQLTWNDGGTQLAVMRGETPDGQQYRENVVLTFRNLANGEEPTTLDATSLQDFPEGSVLSESALTWSKDSSMLFCSIREQQKAARGAGGGGGRGGAGRGGRGGQPGGRGAATQQQGEANADNNRADVDVWHWKDDDVQSVQQRRGGFGGRQGTSSVIHLAEKRLVKLSDDAMDSVTIVGDGRWGIGRDDSQYAGEINWGGSRADYYRVDLKTGDRTLITSALGRPMGTSPDGRYYLYLKGGQVLVYDLDAGTSRNLSLSTRVNFVNEDDDHPYEKPAYGVTGWTNDGRSVILNHKFDLWQLPLDGSTGTCLTSGVGEREQIVFRYRNLDPEAETIDLNQPMLLSAYGEWTKKSGFYSMKYGDEPQPLTFEDVRFGNPSKAENSDAVLITRETFVDYPDYYLTNTKFDNFRRLTTANPQQEEYAWGPKRVLVDYTNSDGVRLQGTLALPAGYEEGKKYPMLVYFYEKMSDRHHEYSFPAFDDRPHMCTYASDGYLVLMPDVVYKPGRPGDCAVDCVTSAVKKVIELGYADPELIALQGHSWGGYQSSFMLTQTDMFCCVVTGAPVTNLISFYNELYKSTGNVQQGITERGQVRMGTTPWDNMELFQSQSPLHNVRNIKTPFIILHGTEDGSVDWHQGLEYYNAAKRNGKEVILLSYPGEGHHLARKPNQIDFQIRMKQFFDHYCKGTPAPQWLTDGVPFSEKSTATPRPSQDNRQDQ